MSPVFSKCALLNPLVVAKDFDNRQIIGVADKLVPSGFQFLIKVIQQDVTQQG